MDIEELERLLEVVKGSDISELELEQEGVTLRVVRGATGVVQAVAPVIQQPMVEVSQAIVGGDTEVAAPAAAGPSEGPGAGVQVVECPLVGTFYRKPSPDAPAFVDVGATVSKGDTLCIVEAMKLMNEIPAPCSGVIEKVLVEDGHVVEFGEPLFWIKAG